MKRNAGFESWNDRYFDDSEITFLIKDSKEKKEEFYKLSSLNAHSEFSYFIRNSHEQKGNLLISKQIYKELWLLLLNNSFSELKNYFTYSFNTGITYLINIRVNDTEKKITGMGHTTHHLEKLLEMIRKIAKDDLNNY